MQELWELNLQINLTLVFETKGTYLVHSKGGILLVGGKWYW